MPDGEYAVMTWNVNGLGNKVKRGLVTRYLKRHRPDIIFLQETHLLGSTCSFLGRGCYTTLAPAGFTRGSRGVVILIRKSSPFHVTQTWVDSEGTYVAVRGVWKRKTYLLVSVYAPLGSNNARSIN